MSNDPLLSRVEQLGEQNAAELKRLSARVAAVSVSVFDRFTPPSRSPTPSRRVSFADQQSSPAASSFASRTQQQYQSSTQQARSSNNFRGRRQCQPSTADFSRQGPDSASCQNCGGRHPLDARFCRAYGVRCYNCGTFNHLARISMCRRARHVPSSFDP